MRPAIRLSAIMELPTIWIFTHDSIGVGEDGPTHQPVEQLISLRAIPGLITIRPGDANEVAEAWRALLQMEQQPVCLVLSRQPLPTLDRERYAPAAGVARGAYVLADPPEGEAPEVILIGTGSEVSLCVAGLRGADRQGRAGAGGVACRAGSCSSGRTRPTAQQVLPPAGHGAGRRRAGDDDRLGALCRPHRRQGRHAQLRRLGAAEGALGQVRLHAREGGRSRARTDRPGRAGREKS